MLTRQHCGGGAGELSRSITNLILAYRRVLEWVQGEFSRSTTNLIPAYRRVGLVVCEKNRF